MLGELLEHRDVLLLADAAPDREEKVGRRDVDVALDGLAELPVARARGDRRQVELGDARRAAARSRRPHRRAEQEHDGLAGRELHLSVHLRAVERARCDERVAVAGDREDVAREAEPELRGHRSAEAHAVHREPEEDDLGLPLLEQSLERVLVDVVLELGLLDADVHDLVDALTVHVERRRIAADHRDRHGAADRARGRDQLVRHVADGALEVLGDDEHAHVRRSSTSSAIRCATCAGFPSSISAPSPRGGVNMRRTR